VEGAASSDFSTGFDDTFGYDVFFYCSISANFACFAMYIS